jgi:phospholipid/cholesterol/gamma-HCH transport system substrate-binding protein
VWVGFFVLIGVLMVLVTMFTFTDSSMFRGRYKLITVVDQAGGVRKGDPVQIRGVNVGRVRKFAISSDGVRVVLELDQAFQVPANSTVRIRPVGLLNGMVVEIVPGSSPKMASAGTRLEGSTAASPLDSADRLVGQSEAVLGRVRALLSDRTVEGVETSSVELSTMMKELSQTAADQRQALGTLVGSLQRSAANVERVTHDPEIEQSIERVSSLLGAAEEQAPKLVETLATLDQSARSVGRVTRQVERGEGTIGKLTKDDALYLNANQAMIGMNQTAAEIRRLAEDIRLHPKRYFSLKLF